MAKCRVDILEHLDGTYAVIWKKRVIGRYDVKGQILRINPWRPAPRPPEFIVVKAREEAKKGEAETQCSRLFPGRPAGARVALQRCPILRRDLLRVREIIKKLNRTFYVL